MSDGTEIDARMVVAEDKEMDQKGNVLGEGGLKDHIYIYGYQIQN